MGLKGGRPVVDVAEGTDTETFDTIEGHEGELIVMRRQPLQIGFFKIAHLGIQLQISREWEGGSNYC